MPFLDQPLVAFDTETATSNGAAHLLEVGAVRVVEGEVQDHFQALVRPAVPVEADTTRVHGLGDDDVRAADDAAEVLARFFAWLDGAPLIAHDARKDALVLGFECARHRLAPPSSRLLDSLALARRAFPDAPDHRLSTLAEHLELEAPELHRALPDAVCAWQVFDAAVRELGGGDGLTEARLFQLCGAPRTLDGFLPARPNRRPTQLRALERARDERSGVQLTYGAPGETPARLRVLPLLLWRGREKSYLEGECLSSGTLKTYRLDRIHRVHPLR